MSQHNSYPTVLYRLPLPVLVMQNSSPELSVSQVKVKIAPKVKFKLWARISISFNILTRQATPFEACKWYRNEASFHGLICVCICTYMFKNRAKMQLFLDSTWTEMRVYCRAIRWWGLALRLADLLGLRLSVTSSPTGSHAMLDLKWKKHFKSILNTLPFGLHNYTNSHIHRNVTLSFTYITK